MNLCCTENLTTMVLTEEGKTDLKNIPDCWAIGDRDCKGLLNFNGTWRLNDEQESQKEIILFSQIGGRQVGFSISILQRRDDPERLALLFGLGETETKREIYLEKAY
jgi:hypothetical protein